MDLSELKNLLQHFDQRKQRAAKRLERDSKGRWCFGLIGLQMAVPEYSIGDVAILRPVEEPPGELALAAALKDKHLMSAVGRHSHGIDHELAIANDFSSTTNGIFNLGWWFISALRVRTLADFLVPAVSDYSWSAIEAVPQGSCHIQLLEDVPRARRLGKPVEISEADLRWVEDNLVSFAELLETPRFRLAVDCLTTHQMEASFRMTIASLWAGIEALFGIKFELRFRLAALAAAYLEPRGDARIARFRAMKTLYDFRSRAVHGAALDDQVLQQHVRDVRSILSLMLCKMIETKQIPIDNEWDHILFI